MPSSPGPGVGVTGPDEASRGVGAIFLVFGALSCLIMSAAALYAEGRLRVLIPAEAWSQIYMAHYCSALFCGAAYLWLDWRRTRRVPRRAFVGFAVGIALYSALFLAAGLLLYKKLLPSWSALLPGAGLLCYGWLLRRRSALADRPERPPDGL
ncbi:MAG: hypothetical protein HY926_13550 [Elusimicrobia bacterium]|nr:hypothetical protein [Elusimicrobiota bacterium]